MPAGTTLGAPAPSSIASSNPTLQRTPSRVIASTRTRRNHGVFLIGSELATVYSSRREVEGLGVTMSVGNGSLTITGGMTPTQARAMARALEAAAAAVDATQMERAS